MSRSGAHAMWRAGAQPDGRWFGCAKERALILRSPPRRSSRPRRRRVPRLDAAEPAGRQRLEAACPRFRRCRDTGAGGAAAADGAVAQPPPPRALAAPGAPAAFGLHSRHRRCCSWHLAVLHQATRVFAGAALQRSAANEPLCCLPPVARWRWPPSRSSSATPTDPTSPRVGGVKFKALTAARCFNCRSLRPSQHATPGPGLHRWQLRKERFGAQPPPPALLCTGHPRLLHCALVTPLLFAPSPPPHPRPPQPSCR